MNRDSIIGFVLIFVILLGWSYWSMPSEEQLKEQRRQDSLKRVEMENSLKEAAKLREQQAQAAAAAPATEATGIDTTTNNVAQDSNTMQADLIKYGEFAAAVHGEEKYYTVETELLKLKVSKKGGNIVFAQVKNFRTYDSLPLVLFDKNTINFSFLLNDKQVQSKDLYFEALINNRPITADSFNITGDKELHLSMRVYPNDKSTGKVDKSRYFEYEYIFKGNDYMFDMNLNMKGMADIIGYRFVTLYWDQVMTGKEKDVEQERKHTTVYYKYVDDEVDYLSEQKEEDSDELVTAIKWISFKQQFFSSTLIAGDEFKKANIAIEVEKDNPTPKYLETAHSEITVPLSGSDLEKFPMKMYLGPNKYKVLKQYNLDLEQLIPLGWGFFLLQWINRFAVIPVFDFLSSLGWNYGIIILVLTILLKILLFPIAYKTYLSSAKMRVLKPEIDEISAKFPKKEDAMKKQQAIMALYKKAGVNPMSGCLPMLLQMPILFAMFRFFPASIELRQQSFLWADDLSSYDSIFSWSQQIPIISTFYGNHVSLFTLLMTVSTIFYTKLNSQMMGNNQQMPGMKTMMYIMPLMFLGFFNNYAAALSYYYFLANIITFGQMFLMRKFVNEEAIHAKIQQNKKKPIKKSKFQKKLEEMAKQKGMNR